MNPQFSDKVERWPLERLIPHARNARTHSEEQVAQIAGSIAEFGFVNPVLVGDDGIIVAGHGRVLAARKLGLRLPGSQSWNGCAPGSWFCPIGSPRWCTRRPPLRAPARASAKQSPKRSRSSAACRSTEPLILKGCPRLIQAVRRSLTILTPPPALTIADWADAKRRLSSEASAEPGQWRTSRAAYQRGIMDAISDPEVESVVVMSSAQVGKTELLLNTVGFHVEQDPAPIMVVMPTERDAETWSKDRFSPMARDTPCLGGRISNPRSRDGNNKILHKKFPGGHLTIVGANAPRGWRAARSAFCCAMRSIATRSALAPKATRSIWPRSARSPSGTARLCWSRRRRSVGRAGSRPPTRRATNGGSTCRARNAARARR
jgi:hypothetical protein